MSRAGRVALHGAAIALVLAGSACGKPPDVTGDAPAPALPPPVASAPPPVDHLGADELVEGPERAFGLALPRGLAVERRFPDLVEGTGPMTVKALVQYLRPRLQGGALRASENVATFEHVTTPGLAPGTDLTIGLAVVGVNRTRVRMSTTIHPPAPQLPDVPARWRQVGLTPEGKLLDPSHLD